jgi:hypothetical protein
MAVNSVTFTVLLSFTAAGLVPVSNGHRPSQQKPSVASVGALAPVRRITCEKTFNGLGMEDFWFTLAARHLHTAYAKILFRRAVQDILRPK